MGAIHSWSLFCKEQQKQKLPPLFKKSNGGRVTEANLLFGIKKGESSEKTNCLFFESKSLASLLFYKRVTRANHSWLLFKMCDFEQKRQIAYEQKSQIAYEQKSEFPNLKWANK